METDKARADQSLCQTCWDEGWVELEDQVQPAPCPDCSCDECPNDEHRLDTCHVCVGSGIVEGFDEDDPCSRCHGRGHFHRSE